MQILGSVVEIVSPTLVLLKVNRPLYLNAVYQVCAVAENAMLAEKYGLAKLYVPKGEVRIVAKQNEFFYLGETFRQGREVTRTVEKPPSLLSGILQSEIIKEQQPGPPSAILGNPTISINLSTKVAVGDCVAEI